MMSRRRGVIARRPGGGTLADQIWDATKPPTSTSWIQRTSADLYYFWQPLGGSEYVRNMMKRYTLAEIDEDHATADDYLGPLCLQDTTVHVFSKTIAGTDASVVRTGTWAGTSPSFYSVVPGSQVTWTTPANTTGISFVYAQATNRGFGKVIIDGDPTRANRCDTAQQAVTAGTLPSTALVANGGTLLPTDRVIDFYTLRSATYPQPLVADGLVAGVHTVTIECTGYKRAASTEARCMAPTTWYYIDPSWTPLTAGTTVLDGRRLRANGATQESAYQMRMGSINSWCGGVHGNMTMLTETISIDGGAPVTMTNGQILESVAKIEMHTTSTFHHPSNGTAPTGNNWRHYTLDEDGLRVEHETEWIVAIGVGEAAYPAMLTLTRNYADERWGKFSKVSGSDITTDLTIASANELFTTLGESDTMWTWEPGGRYVAIARMVNAPATLNNWLWSVTKKNIVWDRLDGVKLYWSLKGLDEPYVAPMPIGTIWHSDTRYRWAKVTDADALCSRT